MVIQDKALKWKAFCAASGPGGQNVNKTATAMELRCKLKDLALPDEVRERFEKLAGSKVTQDGEVVLVAKDHRSQELNRMDAMKKLIDLVLEAINVPAPRKATKPTKASKVRKVVAKKKRAEVKKTRGKTGL